MIEPTNQKTTVGYNFCYTDLKTPKRWSTGETHTQILQERPTKYKQCWDWIPQYLVESCWKHFFLRITTTNYISTKFDENPMSTPKLQAASRLIPGTMPSMIWMQVLMVNPWRQVLVLAPKSGFSSNVRALERTKYIQILLISFGIRLQNVQIWFVLQVKT